MYLRITWETDAKLVANGLPVDGEVLSCTKTGTKSRDVASVEDDVAVGGGHGFGRHGCDDHLLLTKRCVEG